MANRQAGKKVTYVLSLILLCVLAVLLVLLFRSCIPLPVEEVETPPQIVAVEEPAPLVEAVEVTEPVVLAEPVETVQPVETIEPLDVKPIVVEEPPVAAEETKIPDLPSMDEFVFAMPQTTTFWGGEDAVSDDDFWADFVFSDEEIALEDGDYYAKLFVNEDYVGEIYLLLQNEVPFFGKSYLQLSLDDLLAPEFNEQFFSNPEELYSEEYIMSFGVGLDFNLSDMVLNLEFQPDQVPIRSISLGGTNYSIMRQDYAVEGNVELEPAAFSLASNVSAYGNVSYDNTLKMENFSISLNFFNTMSFLNLNISFPFSVSLISLSGISMSTGTWSGYVDFPDLNYRLSFGNIGIGSFNGASPFGLSLEKSYSYGTGTAMSNQFQREIEIIEPSVVQVLINGVLTLNRSMKIGTYRLKDFAFLQGANDVEVRIHPERMGEDASEDQVLNFDLAFDSSLLAKGESYWKLSATIPTRTITAGSEKEENEFAFPWFSKYNGLNDTWVKREKVYRFGDFSLGFDQTIGLGHSFTFGHSLLLTVQRTGVGDYSTNLSASTSAVIATRLGTTRMTASGSLSNSAGSSPSFTINASQRFNALWLQKVGLSGSYTHSGTSNSISLNTSYSFSLGMLKMSTSAVIGYNIGQVKPFTWTTSVSMGTTFGRGLSLSASASINQEMSFRATIGLSAVLSPNASMSVNIPYATSNITEPITAVNSSLTGSANIYVRPGGSKKNSLQLGISNIDFTDLMNHSLSAMWTHSGDLVGLSVRQQITGSYKKFSTAFSANTGFVFADGKFGMSRNIYGPFLIISPQGEMKNSVISVGKATDSSSASAKKVFGNVVYSSLNMYRANTIVVFGAEDSRFSSSSTFLFRAVPVAKQGFIAKVSIVPTITVSGRMFHADGTVYDQYSSPIYKIEPGEEANSILALDMSDGYYLFTDQDGRFILSGLEPGDYMFDLDIDGSWYAACFTVPAEVESGHVVVFKDYSAGETTAEPPYDILQYDESYRGSLFLEVEASKDEATFWEELYSIPEEDPWANTESSIWGDDFADNTIVQNTAP